MIMSDTDDTDDLLLIPPDFFLVHSEPEPPYYSIVDSLIKQVSNLQDRIEGIESMSDISLVGSNLDCITETDNKSKMFNSKNPSARRYYSHDDLYQPASTQSTPQKQTETTRLHSLPNTPSVNRFSPRKNSVKFSSPQKSAYSSKSNKVEEPEVLQEIDTFISNVKILQRNQASRNLENEFNTIKGVTPNLNKYPERISDARNYSKDVEKTIQKLDRQSDRIATQRGEAEKRENTVQERVNRVNAWQCGDNVESVPDYGAGLKNHLFKNKDTKEIPIKQSYLKPNYESRSATTSDFNSTNTTLDKSADSSSESTQLTAYNKSKKHEELNIFDQKRNQLQKEHQVNEQFNHLFKTQYAESFAPENVDAYRVEEERSELLHSPLHDNALSVLNMHKKLLESTNATVKDGVVHRKRGINTLTDNFGLLSLADMWGSAYITQSPSKLSQKLQEEKLRREHCEQLIQELQNKNLELQQKLAVALNVDESKNKTIQQFKEALDKVSIRMETLNEEKATWEREMARLNNQHSIEIEAAYQKIAYYEKEASKSINLAHSNQDKISSLEKRCSDLQSELEHIEVKFKEVEKNYKKEFDRNKQMADIISQKEIELKENKSVLNIAREEVSHSRKAVEVCQTEFTTLKEECARLQAALRDDKHIILNLNEQKRKFTSDIQTYKQNEKTLKDALEQSKLKLDNTKLELRNFYQGQLELIVENKRKEMQNQLDREKQISLDEIRKKELSMAKTAANHIKEISEKCALETKLIEQKYREEIRLYQMQLSQKQKEVDNLQNKLAQLPEKRAQIAKQLQKVMETQWNEALKMINGTPTSNSSHEQNFGNINPFHASVGTDHRQEYHQDPRKDTFGSVSDYDETPVSSRVAKQSESEIQKYINMLLNRAPGNPIPESQDNKSLQGPTTWNPGDLENQNRYEASDIRQSSKDRKSGKPPWK